MDEQVMEDSTPFRNRKYPSAFTVQVLQDGDFKPDHKKHCFGFVGSVDNCDDIVCSKCKLYVDMNSTTDSTEKMISADIRALRSY
jgi:hypothetical protein